VAATTTTMMVSHSYAHLREKPTTKSTLLATLKHGTKVEVLDKVDDGKWTHVKVAGKEGYISTSLLK
ncbi:MAG TPA: SH3 domain-containing protein, partial [Dongiaceae bacterium]|nr:SH3 domain-containing protein [Dongiaceae bacterium]